MGLKQTYLLSQCIQRGIKTANVIVDTELTGMALVYPC